MEEVNFYLEECKEGMEKAISHLRSELKKIRAGKANPAILDGLTVEYYGAATPLNQVASVSAPNARTIAIKPYEKSVISEIEKAIVNSELGLNPQNDGEIVRLNIPPLTEERRKELAKQAKGEVENTKVSIRNSRKDTNDALKLLLKEGLSEDDAKRAEEQVQKLTDQFVEKADHIYEEKEKEIMTV